MTAIRILHISSPLTWRGGEQQLAYLVDELQKLKTQQWVISPKGSSIALYGEKEGWNMVPYTKSGGVDLRLAALIARFVKKNNIQIIHCHDSHAHTGAVLASALFGNKCPVILSRRVDFPIGKSLISRWKYNHRCIKAILCVSDTIRKIVEPAITNKSILLETVHSGIDLDRPVQSEKGKLRSELNLDPNTKIIGNVAALADHKDHFTFIDTARLFKDRADLAFVIIGDGPLSDKIRAYAKEKAPNVIFTGFRNDLENLWPDIDLFLFTSKTEGLGTSVLDALGHGIPVVSTNAGGIPEIISHLDSGYLAEVGDAEGLAEGIRSILESPELRNKLVEGGYRKVRAFDKKETAEKTMKSYNHAIIQSYNFVYHS